MTEQTETAGNADWSEQMAAKLRAALTPTKLSVLNESAAHAGHAGSPGTGNSHFRVQIVAAEFAGMPLVQRHRRIYEILADELAAGVHALAIEAEAE